MFVPRNDFETQKFHIFVMLNAIQINFYEKIIGVEYISSVFGTTPQL